MTSPYARIHKYFLIKQAGTPSSTIQLEYAAAVSCCRDLEPPAWLIRHCEVGDAIEGLPEAEREAVISRWWAAIHAEECDRAIRVASHHAIADRRAGRDASEWVRVERDAEREAEACRILLRAVGRVKVYHRGMDTLFAVLAEAG